MRKKLKFSDIVFRPSWVVGVGGAGIFLCMLMSFKFFQDANQLMLGILFGIIMTCIGFWMSMEAENE